MPFADGCGGVTVGFEERGNIWLFGDFGEEVAVSFFIEAPRRGAGKETVAGSGAEGGC